MIAFLRNMTGRIDISQLNSPPERSEFAVAKYFAALGKDIVFIAPSAIPGQHRPDILMDGVEWEIKCPEGSSKRTIENNMRKALLQSRNVIFDLRQIKLAEKDCIQELEHQYSKRSQLRKMYIIKKDLGLLSYLNKH